MHSYSRQILNVLNALVLLILIGCASKDIILETKETSAPIGVDFSGLWQIKHESNSISPFFNNRSLGNLENNLSRRQNSHLNSLIKLFFESGKSLKISQTEFSLFISYDRSVVEEYTFGEDRLVSIGPIKARRASGWQDSAFVVDTIDESGTILSESWRLNLNDMTLVREIKITIGETETYKNRQSYELKSNT
tara:strand:- start:6788 stop:7366 length:579 start_codon:yes stop_codon:yes gene_type:complete